MLKYRGTQLIRAGFIGVVVAVLIIAIGLQSERLRAWAVSVRHQAAFAEAGGLAAGDDVTVSGIKVGTVTDVSLRRGLAIVAFTTDGNVFIGEDSTAAIRTGNLLGARVLTVTSRGDRALPVDEIIPASRTSSPYSLTEALGELTANTSATDTETLNQSLDTLSTTIDRLAPQLGPTFDGLSQLSRALNDRNRDLRALLGGASDLTGILAARGNQINTLILNADDLFAVLNEQREALVGLLANTTALSQELSGIIHDNEAALKPTLERLNSVTAMLQKNRDNIAKALPGLSKFLITQGETVANGFYYNAYLPNLMPAGVLQPFLDYAFGFRRGQNAGQPPDNAGPRAELQFPRNGIPIGPR
ncbi:MAG: MCE family protein [Actinomycetota bacterium]